jgi:hypothetical protein
MKIDLDNEINEILQHLQMAEGYLACEKIIVDNIRKHISRGIDDKSITGYLEKLSDYFKDQIKKSQNISDCSNYRYTEGFINTLIKMPYWRSWIKTIDM